MRKTDLERFRRLLADGTAATPLVWHMCAVRSRPGYDAGDTTVTEELAAAVASAS